MNATSIAGNVGLGQFSTIEFCLKLLRSGGGSLTSR